MKVSTLFFIISLVIFLIVIGTAGFVYFGGEKKSTTEDTVEVKERRIVAFGDSLTFGYNVPQENSYPSYLQKKLDEQGYMYKVINLGVSGETTSDALVRVNAAVSYEPDVVLLEFGANDYLKSQSPETARANLKKIIETFDQKKIKVILVNIEPHPLLPLPNKEAFAKIMPDLSKEYGLVLVPSFLDGILFENTFVLEDKIHPNAAGYKKAVDENLFPVIKSSLIK